jgi:SAM-dependent methyltransferase
MLFNGLLRLATVGESQSFLGARWVAGALESAPHNWKRPMALRFLSLSPHYFYRNGSNEHLATSDFLESEYERNRQSRKAIIDGLSADYMRPDFVVLDYGCGPGFLASAAAPKVGMVIACDISSGVLACARIINPAPNIEYRRVDGMIPVPDSSVDLICCFAVIQHVTDEILKAILAEFRRVMKSGASAVCHVVVNGKGWQTESDWRSDRSFRGLVKWRFGLHCFSRATDSFEQMISGADLEMAELKPISDLGVDLDDDVNRQHLCIIQKK